MLTQTSIPPEPPILGRFDTAYEWKTVLLLGLSFGLVGLDRWVLGPLFPDMARDLGLNYAALGTLFGALAMTWGVCSILFGTVSDRFGRRRVLIPALLGFSLLSGLTGFAGGLVSLILVRAAMGAAEGAFCPTSVAAVAEASKPSRRGLNQGLQLGCFALFGFGFAPIVATQLLAVLPSWREVFMVVCLPGLVLAFFLYRILRDQPHLVHASGAAQPERIAWSTLLRSRNVILSAACLLCAMSCIFVMGAMVPNYLVDHPHLAPATMGFVLSGMGWGGFLGEFGVAGISDWIGRRWTTALAFVGAIVGTWFFAHCPAEPVALFLWLSVTAFFALGLTSILTGPVPSEAVPPGLTSSAIGIVSGLGEVFGGGIAPVIAGFVAQHYGIEQIFWVPLVGLAIGIPLSTALRETAPRRVGAVG